MTDLNEMAEDLKAASIKFVETPSMRWYEKGVWTVFIDGAHMGMVPEDIPLGFEHTELGEEGGAGGLWFEGKELVDYDGNIEELPKAVIEICEHLGYDMEYVK
tara:strand:+ start:812 stop:1120 length:309 start_codon:yes stop_codon:yes gene_type:complete